MPPVGRPRPDAASIDQFASYLESELDRAAAASPNPGRVPVHRLNRAEYVNAIRDLLALEINGPALLPADEVGHGFDNIAGNLTLSPALLERYMSAARRISRLAVGDPSIGPGYTSKIYVVPINKTQNDRMSEDLPFGSRAGLAVRHHFPLDGEYHLRIKLKKSVYEYVVNLEEAHDLDVRLDGVRLQRFPIGGVQAGKPAPVSFSGTFMAAGGAGFPTQEWDDYRTSADAHLTLTVNVTAGTHLVGVSFVGKSWAPEGILQPPLREYGATVTEITDTSSKPEGPGLESITIDGPYNPAGPGQTQSRQRIFSCRPGTAAADEDRCARQVLTALARRAFRRPVSSADLDPIIEFYREGRAVRGFEGGIETALERLLIDPEFLFRIENDPEGAAAGRIHPVSDLTLASRLSFFLWSSIPDDELLTLAERGKLGEPATLERQVRRMLADDRSKALVDNFFAQWLQLRAAHGQAPDPNVFPEFDENLREAFIRETELFLESQLREDRSVLELLTANYTFLNERLAQHYQIPGVYGSRFRRVTLDRRTARRAAGNGQRPDGHVLRQSDVASTEGEVGAGEHPRHAAAPAAGRRAAIPPRGRRRRAAAIGPRASGAASGESDVRELSCADGSARLRAREFRRGRQVAHAGCQRSDRRVRCARRRYGVLRASGTATGPVSIAGSRSCAPWPRRC